MDSTPKVAVLLLVDVAPRARLWGWSRFVIGRWALRQVHGLQLCKVLGSGHNAGFGLRPSRSRQGLFCAFADEADADHFLKDSAVVRGYRERSDEFFSVKLRAFASRGSWSGVPFEVTDVQPARGPIAALTRASIRPSLAAAFWRMAPSSEASLNQAPGCLLAAGLGEAPLLRQATFSIWDSTDAMDHYAHGGAHLEAIRASRSGGYFTESMFVRFVPYGAQGLWKGRRFD